MGINRSKPIDSRIPLSAMNLEDGDAFRAPSNFIRTLLTREHLPCYIEACMITQTPKCARIHASGLDLNKEWQSFTGESNKDRVALAIEFERRVRDEVKVLVAELFSKVEKGGVVGGGHFPLARESSSGGKVLGAASATNGVGCCRGDCEAGIGVLKDGIFYFLWDLQAP
eukprot:PhF_6_TR38696/c0_g1_i1/m.57899